MIKQESIMGKAEVNGKAIIIRPLPLINHRLPPENAYAIDSDIATRTPCPVCGGPMKYDSHYERREYTNHYRAFSVCTQCPHWEEF